MGIHSAMFSKIAAFSNWTEPAQAIAWKALSSAIALINSILMI
jgi:hypothetical protein